MIHPKSSDFQLFQIAADIQASNNRSVVVLIRPWILNQPMTGSLQSACMLIEPSLSSPEECSRVRGESSMLWFLRKGTQIGEGLTTLSYLQCRRNATRWEGECDSTSQATITWDLTEKSKEANSNYNRCLTKETQLGEGPTTLSKLQFRRNQPSERELCWVTVQDRLPEIKEATRNHNRCLRKTQIGKGQNSGK